MRALLLVALAFIAQGGDKKDPNAADRERFQGNWTTVSLVNDGKTIFDEKTPPKRPATTLAYEGDKWLVKVDKKTVASGVFRIDASKTPKEIDILDGTGRVNDKTKRGIYAFEGDNYKYCLAKTGDSRPDDFTAKEGSGRSLGVMKRERTKKVEEKKP